MTEPQAQYPLWIEGGWTRNRLMSMAREIGQRAFDRGFRMRAYTDEDREFSEADIVKCFHNEVRVEDVVFPDWPRYVGVDLSGAGRPGNVIYVLANSPQGVRYPVEILSGSWKSPETARILHDVCDRHRPMVVKVENNGYQTSLIEWCAEMGWSGMPIEGFMTGRQKADAEVGVPSLAVEFHNGSWFVAMGGRVHEFDCKCGFCEFRKDLRSYPIPERNYDYLMASWFAREGAREGKKAKRKLLVDSW